MHKFPLSFSIILAVVTLGFGQIPTDSLVAYYPFTGNANDASGNGHNGTVYGAVLTADRFGNPNSAYSFNGTTDYIYITNSSLISGSAVTVSCWAYTNTVSGDGRIIGTGNQDDYQLGRRGDSVLCGVVTNGVNNFLFTPPGTFPNQKWIYLCMSYDGAYNRIYINGVLIDSVISTGQLYSTQAKNLTIGTYFLNGNPYTAFFNGYIDDIRIYSRALNNSEILAIYHESSLVAYYPFTSNANDSSGYGNNGTVNGATLTTDRLGSANSAYSFNGQNNTITVPNSASLQLTGSFTVSLFFKYNGRGTAGKGYWTLINKDGNVYGWTDPFHILLTADSATYYGFNRGVLVARCANGVLGQGYNLASKDTLNDYKWHNVSIVYDSAQLKYSLYIDAHLDTSVSVPAGWVPAHDNSPLTIGVWPAYNAYFNGSIDQVRIYNRPLSGAEIQAFGPFLPSTPTLSSPANGAVNQSTSLNLSWGAVNGATSYRLQVSTASTFTTTVFDDSTLTSATKSIGPLSVASTYYWRVNAKDVIGTSAWSAVWNFATVPLPPGAPSLTSPANGATNQPLSLNLSWGAVSGAGTYRVEVSTASDFNSTVVDDSTLTATTRSVSGLTNSVTYYWRVNAKNAGGTSGWSSTWSYTTIVSVPGVPSLTSPTNGATNVALSPTLSWGAVSGAATYRLQVSTASTFASTVFDDSTVTAASRSVNGLANSTVYYWRVNAKNIAGTSAWSSVWSYTTVPPAPGAPITISPVTGVANVPITVPLVWHSVAGAISYRVLVSTVSDFSTTIKDTGGLADTTLALAGLLNNTRYYWCVCATNAGGSGGWSVTAYFTTIVTLPAQVALINPQDTAKVSADSVLLMWNKAMPSVTRYLLEVATDSAMSHLLVQDSSVADTTRLLTALSNNITYWWRVKAYNAAGWGVYSQKVRFTVIISAVLPGMVDIRNFSLSGTSGIIRYALPSRCFVSLKYYDTRGRLVGSFINCVQGAGNYSLTLPVSSWARGAYIQVFSAGDIVRRDRLVVWH